MDLTLAQASALSAAFCAAAAVFIAVGAYILMRCVLRIGRIVDDLRRSLAEIETFTCDNAAPKVDLMWSIMPSGELKVDVQRASSQ